MIDGFGLDDTIKLIFDGEIIVKPSIPLNDEEKAYLIDQSFAAFHREMKYRLYVSKCLETNELQEYANNKLFLQARAFIFMSRCLNRFDKGRYQGQEFGILHGSNNKIDSHDFIFARDFQVLSLMSDGLHYRSLNLGQSFESAQDALKGHPVIENALKVSVALARLKFFWFNFYRDSINQLAGETIKWKKNKGIPTKPDLKKSGVDPDSYIHTLKEVQDFQVKSRTAPEVKENNDDNIFSFERYSQLEEELMAGMSRSFRKFFFCSNVLKMEHQEMVLEFGDQFKSLREEELNFKKDLKKMTGVR